MKIKKWYLSKTIVLGIMICLGGIAEYLSGLPVGASVSTIVAGVLTVILRCLTYQPIGK